MIWWCEHNRENGQLSSAGGSARAVGWRSVRKDENVVEMRMRNGASGGRGRLTQWAQAMVPLLGLFALLLSACGQQGGGPPLAKNQTFTWPFLSSSGTADISGEELDPAQISLYTDFTSASLIYSGLVTIDNNLRVANDLAKSIDVDSTGKTYTFHLLPNLTFSDGKPIKAQDFAYSIDRSLDPSINAADGDIGLTYLGHILGANDRVSGTIPTLIGTGPNAGLTVTDDQTLVVHLDQPVGFFLEALTYPTGYVLEKSLVDKYPNGGWVNHLDQGGCSGPFKVKSYGGGKELSYVPNSGWEAATRHTLTLTEIDRPFVDSQETEYKNYRAGQYDYTDVPDRDYAYARGQDDFREVGELTIDYFGFNFNKAPFDRLEIRQAFDLALNKQLLVDRIVNGGAIPTNHIVPQGMPGYNPKLTNPPADGTQSLTGNQAAALQLLGKARNDCKGNAFTDPDYCPYITGSPLQPIIIFTNKSNATRVELAKAAADAWSTVLNLDVEVQTVTTHTLYSTIFAPGNPYQAWSAGWVADYPDPQDWLTLQFASTAGYNASHVDSSDLDALLAKADVEQNPIQRMQLYNQAEQQVVNLVGWMPYMQEKAKWRLRPWVHGFGLNPQASIPDIAWSNVYVIAH